MNNFFFDTDEETTARISEQRDNIFDYVIDRFKDLMSENDIDSALALADEFFEWMNPEQCDEEPTIFFNEQELQRRYLEITEGWWINEIIDYGVYQGTERRSFRWCWGYTPWDQYNEEAMRWP